MADDDLHGLLIVDKAEGPTSHDVVGIARRALGTRAVGHTGTLDPMATGVLVLAVGEATKLVSALGASSKSYEATVALGRSTTTLDAQGDVDATAEVPALTHDAVREAAQRFLGEIVQRAPRVSAIKVDGKSLHKRARKGEVFEAPLRNVRLDAISVVDVRSAEIDLVLTCGSGFYVRSLARDLAAALGTVGHLSRLRRTHNGGFSAAEAVSFEALRAARSDEGLRPALRTRLRPLVEVCRQLPHALLDEEGAQHARHGRVIAMTHVREQAACSSLTTALVAFDPAGTPLALVERSGDQLRVVRGFRLS